MVRALTTVVAVAAGGFALATAAAAAHIPPPPAAPPVAVATVLPVAALSRPVTPPSRTVIRLDPSGWRFPALRLVSTQPAQPIGFRIPHRRDYLDTQRQLIAIAGTLLALSTISLLVRA